MFLLERDRNDREEKEGHTPSEGDPKAECEDDGLGDQHLDSFHRRAVQHFLYILGFQIHCCVVAFITSCCTEGFSAFVKSYATTGFFKTQDDEEEEGYVCEALNSFNPSKFEMLV